jgi:acetyl-CoA C-acetyltransferase
MNTSPEVFVLPGLRSPFCKIDRELGRLDALELSAPVVQQTVAGESGLGRDRASEIDLVIWGSVIPTLAVSNWAREVWFDSGLAATVPGQGIVQACATSLAAATHAAGQVRARGIALALCGGVESMTHTQIGLSKGLSRTIRRVASAGGAGRAARTLGQVRLSDLKLAVPAVKERKTGKTMGRHAEEMAKEWSISREAQDELALASHLRASADGAAFFRPLLVSPGTFPADRDTIPRPDTTLEKLAQLRPAFDKARGTLTAGNSSPLTDGAAACWIASAEGAGRLPSTLPRARLMDWEEAAIDLRRDGLLIAPAIAIARLLARHDLGYEDIELWEFHEAFAAQVLSTIEALQTREWLSDRSGVDRDFGSFPSDRVNPNGGSVALGHPFAATGARMLSQTVRELADRPAGTLSVVSVCAAGGLGHVALLEAV